jgi:hypothetical protein
MHTAIPTNYLCFQGQFWVLSESRQGINKNQDGFFPGLRFLLPALQASGVSLDALAILIVAIGLAGLAILILFAKKKI